MLNTADQRTLLRIFISLASATLLNRFLFGWNNHAAHVCRLLLCWHDIQFKTEIIIQLFTDGRSAHSRCGFTLLWMIHKVACMMSLQANEQAGKQMWEILMQAIPVQPSTPSQLQMGLPPSEQLAQYQLLEARASEHVGRHAARNTMKQFWEEFLTAMASGDLPPHIGSARVSPPCCNSTARAPLRLMVQKDLTALCPKDI